MSTVVSPLSYGVTDVAVDETVDNEISIRNNSAHSTSLNSVLYKSTTKKGWGTMSKKLNARGFTLIELLIVIIIIGILAAIAFVAYSGAQNKANKAAAQSTLSEVRSKLAEYNSSNGNYPVDMPTFDTWLSSSSGGNNSSLATTYVAANGYTYGATPSACDNSATPCTGYTATAKGTIFGGTTPANDISVTN